MIARKLHPDHPAGGIRFWRNLLFLAAILPVQGVAATHPEEVLLASRVSVLPIFFVPQGKAGPSHDQAQGLMRHLHWSQSRYQEKDHCFLAADLKRAHFAQHLLIARLRLVKLGPMDLPELELLR
jgi:hypothetical protein